MGPGPIIHHHAFGLSAQTIALVRKELMRKREHLAAILPRSVSEWSGEMAALVDVEIAIRDFESVYGK